MCRSDAVGILLIVEFEVGLGALAELMADQQAAAPALRDGVVAEVVADFSVQAYWPDTCVDLQGQIEGRSGGDQAAWHGASRIVEEQLRVGGDAQVRYGLGGIVCAGRVARILDGFGGYGFGGLNHGEQPGAEAMLHPGIVGMVLVKAPLNAEQAFSEAAEKVTGLGRSTVAGSLRTSFLDSNGNFIFELDAVTESVVDVEVGDLVGAGGRIAVADPPEVDLPMLIAGRLRVVGAEGWTSLRARGDGKKNEQRKDQAGG